jgi:hypothetical protein
MLNTYIIDQHLTQVGRQSIFRMEIELPNNVSPARNRETTIQTRFKLSAYRSNLCILESQTKQYLALSELAEHDKSANPSPSLTFVNSDVLISATTPDMRI